MIQHGHPLTERHRFDLIVRDVQRRHAEALVQPHELRPHLDAELGVEVREGLVHQERLGMPNDRPAHRDALALAARQGARLAVEQVLDPEQGGGLGDPLLPLRLRHPLRLEREADVRAHGHVRIERVVLEHHRDVAVDGVEIVDDGVADEDLARGGLLEPRDHPQRGRLAAPGRADEDHELTVLDPQAQVVDCDRAVLEALGDAAELDRRH